MEPTIFRYILRYSKKQQLWLLAVIAVSYPFLYMSLDVPKLIINQAIGDLDPTKPPPSSIVVPLFGVPVLEVEMEQLWFLLALSGFYLLLVFINGAMKYYINIYKGRMGERLLRRLRYQLYERILRFPLTHFRKVSQGELIPMITAEVEPLGGFIGTAFADPMFQGGQLVIILGFIMVQDPYLGAAAIALYPFQMYVIPKLQRVVNQLGKRRVQNVRQLADHIGESVAGIVEVHAHDAAQRELSRFAGRLGVIYWIRYEIYRRKFFIKFLNSFIDKLTPFFFFSIGGYLVIEGALSLGALVAVLAAYKDLAGPWKDMLSWYQQKEDIKIKYAQVVEQFDPPRMLDEARQDAAGSPDGDPVSLDGAIVAQRVSIVDDDGFRPLDGAAFKAQPSKATAIVGQGTGGRTELMQVLAGLLEPTSGAITIGGRDMETLPRSVTGRELAYVGPNAWLQAGSVADALAYGLRRRPLDPVDYAGEALKRHRAEVAEAELAGNTIFDYQADWTDYGTVGAGDRHGLEQAMIAALQTVDFGDDLYQFGLRGVVDPDKDSDIAGKILDARNVIRESLDDPELAALVEPFDAATYNRNATVAENVLFGVPLGDALAPENIAEHPYMLQVLGRVGLTGDFLNIGEQVAETMIELFADLPPGHEFFDQFSFIEAEELPEFQAILGRAARGLEELPDDDRRRLMALTFKMIPARHRLDLIDETLRKRLIEARRVFAADLPGDLAGAVAFFDGARYNAGASIQENILFGKLVYGKPHAARRMGAAIAEMLDSMSLRETVMTVGLDSPIGAGGSRLSPAQRQKLAIARVLLRRPQVLVINEADAALDARTQALLVDNVLASSRGRTVVWSLGAPELAEKFDHVVVMEAGRVIEEGDFAALRGKSDSALNRLFGDG